MKKLLTLIFVIFITSINTELINSKYCNPSRKNTNFQSEDLRCEEHIQNTFNYTKKEASEEVNYDHISYVDMIYDLDRFYTNSKDRPSILIHEVKNSKKERLNVLKEKVELYMESQYFEEFYDF